VYSDSASTLEGSRQNSLAFAPSGTAEPLAFSNTSGFVDTPIVAFFPHPERNPVEREKATSDQQNEDMEKLLKNRISNAQKERNPHPLFCRNISESR
jgi:hypothetical protein